MRVASIMMLDQPFIAPHNRLVHFNTLIMIMIIVAVIIPDYYDA